MAGKSPREDKVGVLLAKTSSEIHWNQGSDFVSGNLSQEQCLNDEQGRDGGTARPPPPVPPPGHKAPSSARPPAGEGGRVPSRWKQVTGTKGRGATGLPPQLYSADPVGAGRVTAHASPQPSCQPYAVGPRLPWVGERGIPPPPSGPSAPSSARPSRFRKRGPAGTRPLPLDPAACGGPGLWEFSTLKGRSGDNTLSTAQPRWARPSGNGERPWGRGGRCPSRPPRPHRRQEEEAAGPRGAGVPWLREARDLVRPKVDLTGCQPRTPPHRLPGPSPPALGRTGARAPRFSLPLALTPPGAPPSPLARVPIGLQSPRALPLLPSHWPSSCLVAHPRTDSSSHWPHARRPTPVLPGSFSHWPHARRPAPPRPLSGNRALAGPSARGGCGRPRLAVSVRLHKSRSCPSPLLLSQYLLFPLRLSPRPASVAQGA
ncbi:basic proline-rich protein-like [Pseudorca crassidens]|uniref:basic proline-rich protein-like n=1 Tax=Pseudorca crassidens TaxID=82174 RepID=UPI00352E1BF1